MSVETAISDGSLGWTIRKIKAIGRDGSVTLNDGISFRSPCFAAAKVGEIWAVKHEPCAWFAFGAINQACFVGFGE